jgi:uncharacterized protein (DUF2147 family)
MTMNFRIASITGALVVAGTLALQAADISGKWTAQVPGRDGQTRETTITLKQDGEKLTGTTSGMNGETPISDGTVKGDDVAFTVVANINGNEVKLLYKGKVTAEGIKFTRMREGSDRPPQEFLATKAKT